MYNRYYYFGTPADEHKEDHERELPKDWLENTYFRVRVEYDDEEIKIEDSCGRMVPFSFTDIKELRKVLKTIKKEVSNV